MSANDRPPPAEAAQRYSDRAGDYERFRPGYPRAMAEHLRNRGAIAPGSVVADIGAGTGLSSQVFVDADCEVYAVEPNAAMRAAAERRFGDRTLFHGVDASAEATTLPDASIDLVVAGTAFHWFDRASTRREFARIQRPRGHVALFWNVRGIDSEFMRGYEALLQAHCPDYAARHKRERIDEASMRAFFGAGFIEKAVFPNPQTLDFEALRGRLLSASYAPLGGQPGHDAMVDALRALFQRNARDGRVAMLYDTHLYLGRLSA